MTRHPAAPVPDRLFDDERSSAGGPLHRALDVAAGVGPGCPGPLHLRLQRERHDRGLRLGPGHRPAPAGHRPAQRHAPRRADPGRRDDLVVRRHRRRRVRALGRASRSPADRPTPTRSRWCPGVPDGYPAGLEIGPGRRRVGRVDRRRHHDLAAPRRRPGAVASTRTRRTPGSGRCPRTRRCWRSATPSTATPGTRRCAWCGRRTARWSPRSPTAPAKGWTPLASCRGRGTPAAAAARAARPRGAADLGRRRGHRARS